MLCNVRTADLRDRRPFVSLPGYAGHMPGTIAGYRYGSPETRLIKPNSAPAGGSQGQLSSRDKLASAASRINLWSAGSRKPAADPAANSPHAATRAGSLSAAGGTMTPGSTKTFTQRCNALPEVPVVGYSGHIPGLYSEAYHGATWRTMVSRSSSRRAAIAAGGEDPNKATSPWAPADPAIGSAGPHGGEWSDDFLDGTNGSGGATARTAQRPTVVEFQARLDSNQRDERTLVAARGDERWRTCYKAAYCDNRHQKLFVPRPRP